MGCAMYREPISATTIDFDRPQIRQEGEDYLLFLPEQGQYLFANEATIRIIEMIESRRPVEEIIAWIAEACGLNVYAACIAFGRLAEALESAGTMTLPCDSVGAELPPPRVWGLEEMLGEFAEKCETFGMPF